MSYPQPTIDAPKTHLEDQAQLRRRRTLGLRAIVIGVGLDYISAKEPVSICKNRIYHPTMIAAIPDPKSIPANAPEHCPVCPVLSLIS